MADHYYSLTVPQNSADPNDVTVATSKTAANFELRVTDGVSGNNKVELLEALEHLEYYIATHNAPA